MLSSSVVISDSQSLLSSLVLSSSELQSLLLSSPGVLSSGTLLPEMSVLLVSELLSLSTSELLLILLSEPISNPVVRKVVLLDSEILGHSLSESDVIMRGKIRGSIIRESVIGHTLVPHIVTFSEGISSPE